MTDEEWAEAEVQWELDEQERVDRVRIRGYALAAIQRVSLARTELDRCISVMQNAQSIADKALKRLQTELAHAEEVVTLMALGDASVNDEMARRLEEQVA